jgi:hypothetical protein
MENCRLITFGPPQPARDRAPAERGVAARGLATALPRFARDEFRARTSRRPPLPGGCARHVTRDPQRSPLTARSRARRADTADLVQLISNDVID